MRFGVTILTDRPWAQARSVWRRAEELGFDHAWTYDHLVWGGLVGHPWRSAFPVLAAAAGVTEQIALGTLVTSPNGTHPYRLLRDVQAVDDVAGGRFRLALGTGGGIDSGVLGQPELRMGARVDRLQEFVTLYRRLQRDDPVSAHGEYYTVAEARTAPSAAAVPLILAGDGPRSVRFAAAHGDGWVTTGPWGADLDAWLAGLRRSVAVLDEELARLGRASIDRFVLLDDTARYTVADPALLDRVLGEVAAMGFTDAITHWPRPDGPFAGTEHQLLHAVEQVLPAWR